MTQKKRGLGRGLGALIPSGPESDRPVDVFFPAAERGSGALATVVAPPEESTEPEGEAAAAGDVPRGRGRSAKWDSAIAGGRLSIRGGAVDTGKGSPGPLNSASPIGEQTGGAGQGPDEDSSMARSASSPSSAASSLLDGSGAADQVGAISLGVITAVAVEGDLADAAVALPVDESAGHTSADQVAAPQSGDAARAQGEAPASGDGADAAAVSALSDLPDSADVSRETGLVPVPGARFAEVPLASIRPNTWQPRTVFDESDLDELVASIAEIGILQPIVVRPEPESEGRYELIMGERRWRAAQLAGLETVPAIVRETDDQDMLRDALLENLHRAALNPLEEAAAYRQLLDDFGCTHEELATRIARSRPQISNTLRLLKLPPLVQRRVAAGVLSAGHARALLGLSDGAEIERLAQRIVSEGLSVRATEEIVTLLTSGDTRTAARRSPRAGQRSEAMDELASRLSDRFETRVKVDLGKAKGRVTVEFASVEDLNRIIAVMAPEDPGLLRN